MRRQILHIKISKHGWERCNKLFLNLQQSNTSKKNIYGMVDNKNNIQTTEKNMEETEIFY